MPPTFNPPSQSQQASAAINPTWVVTVLAAGLISALSAPGQTAALSVFTDPFIAELHIDRSAISLSYLVGTLIGALMQPLIGKAADRWDIRKVLMVIAGTFSLALFAMSFVSEIFGLTAGFIGVRMLGQGALSLAVTTAVARAIQQRRGLALGISAAIGSSGISLAPIGLEQLISAHGIQATWRWEALAVLVVVVPAAFLIRRPKTSTVQAYSRPGHGTQPNVAAREWTLNEARRTGMFWVLVAALSATSMLTTALSFHLIAVLGEQGLSPLEAAANFLPQTFSALLTTLAVGALADRVDPRLLTSLSMLSLAASLLLLGLVSPGWSAILYGLVLGIAIGGLRGMEAATFARYYGVVHIGAIRGLATSISLAASAFGPYVLAVGAEITGGFVLPAAVFSAIPLAVIITAVTVRPPR